MSRFWDEAFIEFARLYLICTNRLYLGKVQHGNVLVNGLASLMIICWESLGVPRLG